MPLKIENDEMLRTLEVQAILHLSGFGPSVISAARHSLTNEAIGKYAKANSLAKTDPAEITTDEMHTILTGRLATDDGFRAQVRLNAFTAIREGNAYAVRAAQAYFNWEECYEGEKLAIDGDPKKLTNAGADRLRSIMQSEVQDAREQADQKRDLNRELQEKNERLTEENERLERELDETQARLEEAEEQLSQEQEPEKRAAEIADLANARVGDHTKRDKYGTRFLSSVFGEVVSGVLDDETSKRGGRYTMDQFRDSGAYRDIDSDFMPEVGDVVFYGVRGRKVGIIDKIDENGNLIFTDAEGERRTLYMAQADKIGGKAYFGAHGIRGFGDSSEMIEFAREADKMTQPVATNPTVEGQQLSATLPARPPAGAPGG